jgi:hypothetical protein
LDSRGPCSQFVATDITLAEARRRAKDLKAEIQLGAELVIEPSHQRTTRADGPPSEGLVLGVLVYRAGLRSPGTAVPAFHIDAAGEVDKQIDSADPWPVDVAKGL